MYAERRSTVVRGAVVWERADGGLARILPDGCTDLIWTGDDLIVAGPDTTAHVSTLSAPQRLVAVRFPPGVGPGVFRASVPFAHVALQAGYFDQAHLSRDVKRLSGVTLREVLAG